MKKEIYMNVPCDQAKCFGNTAGFCQVLSKKKEPCKFYKTPEQCEREHKKVTKRLEGMTDV